MKATASYLNRLLMFGAIVLAVASVAANDVDKVPIYLLLAYILWKLS